MTHPPSDLVVKLKSLSDDLMALAPWARGTLKEAADEIERLSKDVIDADQLHYRAWSNQVRAEKAEARIQELEESVKLASFVALGEKLAKAEGRVGKLREALKWYASEDTWCMQGIDLSDYAVEVLAEDSP